MRLRNKPYAKQILQQSKYVVKNFPIKLNQNMVIELGMGKGHMLTQMGHQGSKKFFIGIEKSRTIVVKAIKLAQNFKLKNFVIVVANIKNLNYLVIGKVNLIWITFPDPWPKNKHKNHRLVNLCFFKKYKMILNKNGLIKLKTDCKKVFNLAIKSILISNMTIISSTTNYHNSKYSTNNIMTYYEKKSYHQKPIYYLVAKF